MPTLLQALAAGLVSATPTQSLADQARAFTDAPLQIDPRLGAATCPGGYAFAWIDATRTRLAAACAARGERMQIPVADQAAPMPAPAAPKLRRGEQVTAIAEGRGFRVSVAAIAEPSRGSDRLDLRNSQTGRRFAARMDPDGLIRVQAAPNSR